MDYSYGFGWPYGEIDDYIDASGIADIDAPLLRQNNLSDVYDAAAARANIEAMYGGNNLSEITNPTQARLNLGITSSSGTMSGYGWDILENGNWNDLNTNYPASGYLDQIAFVKDKTTTLLGLVTTKQDGLYISDGTTWNKTNLQVQFFDDSLEFRDDADNSKTMKFQLSDISPSGTTILNIPNESGTIARIEDLSSIPAPTGALLIEANLSDLENASTARDNLGLGNVATADFGITSTTAASGDHLHSIYQQTSEKGTADGYASLDSNALIPSGEISQNNMINISNIDGLNEKDAFNTLYGKQQYVQGFDHYNPNSMGTPSWDDGTRTFSLDVKGGESEFYFWVNGKKIIKTSIESITIPDATGTYYFYFDNTGTPQYILEENITYIVFYNYAIFGGVYWNATTGVGLPWEERHGLDMSSSTHVYNHLTFGARYDNGLNPVGFVAGNTTYTNVSSGSFWDEDNQHLVASDTTHAFLYRSGANGEWTRTTPSNEHGYIKGGDTYYSWNEFTGGVWQLTEGGTTTDFFIMFWIASPSLGGPTINKIVSQSAYSTAGNARDAIDSEVAKIKTNGLPSPEFIFIYATIVKRDGKLQTIDGTNTYYELRSIKGSAPGNDAIINSPLTTKGDLYTYSTTDTRLPVGSFKQIPMVNSATATGLEWVDASGVIPFGKTSYEAASGDHLHSIYQQTSEKGIADGYASLDGSGLIPYNQIPSGIHSNLQNLNWSSAGHTIDSTVDFNNNSASGLKTTQFDTSYTITGGEEVGTSYWDSANGTFSDVLENGVIGQRFKEAFVDGQNNTGDTITNGTPVEYASSIGNSGNFRITLAKAEPTKPVFYFIGIATENIIDGYSGKITTRGKVRGIQTNGANYGESWDNGDIIYLSGTIAGYLTNIMPEAPIPAIKVGVVISAHASNGTLEIKQSYPERLSELSDVNGTPLASDGQIPVWHNGSGYFDFTENIYNYQAISGKGIANGYASLGADGLVPNTQLPASISSSGDLLAANNLFDLTNIATARDNLGLSAVAIADFGKTSTTVASGDHLHSQYLTSSTLGNMSLQDSQNVNISGGIINGVDIGINNAGFIASTGINITGNANFPLTHLADGATINTNCASGNNFVVTLGGDRTLANPTNLSEGVYNWVVKQDGTGSRTLAFGNKFQFAPSGAPTLSIAPSAMDVISGIYDNQGDYIICSYVLSGG